MKQHVTKQNNIKQQAVLWNNVKPPETLSVEQYRAKDITLQQYETTRNNIEQYRVIGSTMEQCETTCNNIEQQAALKKNIKQYKQYKTI